MQSKSCTLSSNNNVTLNVLCREEFDITHEFSQSITETIDGEEGFQEVNYEVSLVKADFQVSLDEVGQNIKCHARIHRHPEFKRTATAVIEVKCK